MKKILLVIFLLIICCLALTSCAVTIGSEEYVLIEDGTAYEVCYSGLILGWELEIPSEHEGLPVKGIGPGDIWFTPFVKNVIIPEGITYMSTEALAFGDYKSISIPSTMVNISSDALYGNDNLKEIIVSDENPIYHSDNNCIIETETKTLVIGCRRTEIPDDGSVEKIGRMAFAGNYSIQTINIPATIKEIGDMAFYNCAELNTINYEGTTYEWKLIKKGALWDSLIADYKIIYSNSKLE